ncbi:hypothetical protein Pmani_003187 [Petrolisthes manimaculis]|uniref:Uncharacterized protein n=1 Tax=Petrolisthes manimaculis TaxID=1843537 RepID=A0AAE1QH98_9EUCA|nr:hypothetical protein Pmani_003187 [Petrolisthes manimaculis]
MQRLGNEKSKVVGDLRMEVTTGGIEGVAKGIEEWRWPVRRLGNGEMACGELWEMVMDSGKRDWGMEVVCAEFGE